MQSSVSGDAHGPFGVKPPPAHGLRSRGRQLLSASRAALAGALFLGTSFACSSADEEAFALRIESLPGSGSESMAHWAYTLESPVAARLEVSFVDVRRPDEGVGATFDVEAGAPVAMDCFLPAVLEPWTERPRFSYDLKITQGDRNERATDFLPAGMFPEVLVSTVPGFSSLSAVGHPNRELTFPLDTPLVLTSWIFPGEHPPGDGGYGLWQVGPAGEPGGPFEVPETLYHGIDQPVADYPGALLQLRLRLTPILDE